mmetsp:Transcript_21880/g.39905  ORF Transcript_21880/g.39905 Transcript_21880/m.39905 type:complete len:91 (-) Transcript_21880:572-844(-)
MSFLSWVTLLILKKTSLPSWAFTLRVMCSADSFDFSAPSDILYFRVHSKMNSTLPCIHAATLRHPSSLYSNPCTHIPFRLRSRHRNLTTR